MRRPTLLTILFGLLFFCLFTSQALATAGEVVKPDGYSLSQYDPIDIVVAIEQLLVIDRILAIADEVALPARRIVVERWGFTHRSKVRVLSMTMRSRAGGGTKMQYRQLRFE